MALCAALAACAAGPPVAAAATQPAQPTSGPGGSDYAHADWRVTSGGTGADGWYVFEPVSPRPRSAPLALITHGYFEYTGYDSMYTLIRHTVRQGNVVIYPRWQTGVATPCPGPFDIEPCIASTVNGIRGALAYLHASADRVQPQLDRTSYFGYSFGGIITANVANRYASLGLPRPRAIFLEDPHDGGLAGPGEPALDDSLAGVPPAAKLECHSGASGVIGEAGKAGSSCNAVFRLLAHIPNANKDLVMTTTDPHGDPDLMGTHGGVCAGAPGTADAYDWNFCWKVWDALRDAAYHRRNCRFALGDTPQHRSNGEWSDGVPILPLKIQDVGPIGPASPDHHAAGGGCRGPKLRLNAAKTQSLNKVNLTVTLDDEAKVFVRGAVRGANGFRFANAAKRLVADRKQRIRLRLRGSAPSYVQSVLAAGPLPAKLVVTARNRDGSTTKKRTIRLTG